MKKILIYLFRCEWESVSIDDIVFNISCRSKKFFTKINLFEIKYCPWCGKKVYYK